MLFRGENRLKNISVVDYIGNCDAEGKATGHVLKTLTEAVQILEDNFDVKLILTNDYTKYFQKMRIKYTLGLSSKISFKKGKIYKLVFQLQKIFYTSRVLKKEQKIWFLNTDFWLFVSLMMYRKKKNQQIYVTNYIDYYSNSGLKGKFRSLVYRTALKRVDYIFTTNSNLDLNKHVYVPDYAFDSEAYNKYTSEQRKKHIYMCGSINEAKDVEGLIHAFNQNNEPLTIRGNFMSKELYSNLKAEAESNISIYDQRLDDDDYYKNIAHSQFVVLPYKKENYSNRSSGVILEAIFLGAIVIAPNFLLKHLRIAGIGYDDIRELEGFHISSITQETLNSINELNQSLLEKYDLKTIKKRYLTIFNESK